MRLSKSIRTELGRKLLFFVRLRTFNSVLQKFQQLLAANVDIQFLLKLLGHLRRQGQGAEQKVTDCPQWQIRDRLKEQFLKLDFGEQFSEQAGEFFRPILAIE